MNFCSYRKTSFHTGYRYEPRRTRLHFVERTRRGAVLVVLLPMHSKIRKGNKERKKTLILAGKIKNENKEWNEIEI